MNRLWIACLLLFLGLPGVTASAAEWNTNENNVALDGHDVMSYWQEDRAVRGKVGFSTEYQGATFYFSSQQNLDAFRADPEKFAPKFGGFCAFGVASQKAKFPVNAQTFKVYNGALLLFFNNTYQGKKLNTKILWNHNEQHLYEKAAQAWTEID